MACVIQIVASFAVFEVLKWHKELKEFVGFEAVEDSVELEDLDLLVLAGGA